MALDMHCIHMHAHRYLDAVGEGMEGGAMEGRL